MTTTTYVSIAADLDENLKPFYFVKVGMTGSCPRERCDKQRLKLIWAVKSDRVNFEAQLQSVAHKLFGCTSFNYRPAGVMESYGQFESPQFAFNACWTLLREWSTIVDQADADTATLTSMPDNRDRLTREMMRCNVLDYGRRIAA